MPPAYVDPCRGHFPHRQAAGCCPIQITSANRVAANGVRPATTGPYIPHDICQAVDSRDLRYLNMEDHTHDAGFDLNGSSVEDLMDAAQSGVADGATVIAELARRIPTAANADERGVLTASITGLKVMVETGIVTKSAQLNNGNLLKLWGLSVKRATAIGGPITSAAGPDVTDMESMSADLSSTSKSILQIRRAPEEFIFDSALYIWSTLSHSLGIMTFEISSHMLFEVAYATRLKYKENFWTAQEYLIDCLDHVDRGVCKASVVANHDRNLLLDKARRHGAGFEAVLSKKIPAGGSTVKEWNGRCQPAGSKANYCAAFNQGRSHDDPKLLTADGTCRFRHVCNHWVDNKGPGGRCDRSDHGRHSCNNPNKCAKALE